MAAPTYSPAPTTSGTSTLSITSWCLFDWANSAFNTVIGTFVFSVYFAAGIWGDQTEGSAAWSYAIGLSGLAIAVLSPILGAIADHSGPRKPWIAGLVAITVALTALLWFAEPDPSFILFVLVVVGVANVTFELSGVFYNAMLPSVAPPGKMGRVSGWAWGLGYAGGLVCLVLALLGLVGLGETPAWIVLPTDGSENVRATALLVAVWFAVFSLPMFLFTPDRPSTGVGLATAVGRGWRSLIDTLRRLPQYRDTLKFLIASALYRDAIITITAVGGLYAADVFDMGMSEIIIFAIGLNVTAGLGAAAFAWVDDWIGPKRTVIIALIGMTACGVPILLIDEAWMFIVLALGLGIFFGPTQAASRTLMARLSPPELRTEFFGLYALTGKSIAFLGPMLFGLATDAFDNQRFGMATVLLFIIGGLALLISVREPEREVGS